MMSNFISPLTSVWSPALILLSGLHQKGIDKINLQVSQLLCYQASLSTRTEWFVTQNFYRTGS